MGARSDVAIAVSLEIDKIMRDTLRALAQGHESIELLDNMFVAEQRGWKLYHHDSIRWYPETDVAIRNIHDILDGMSDGAENERDDRSYAIHVIQIPEEVPEDWIRSMGSANSPFALGYTLKLEYLIDEDAKKATKTE